MTSAEPLIAYADLAADPLIAGLRSGDPGGAARDAVAAALFCSPLPARAAVAARVLGSDGPFAHAAHAGLAGPRRRARAARELAALRRVADDAAELAAGCGAAVDAPHEASGDAPAFAALCARMAAAQDWAALVDDVAAFHASEGLGALAAHRVLRFGAAGLAGVPRPDPIGPADLVGGADVRAPLAAALGAFARGRPAVDALLYGPPGTGKSAAVRALAHGLAGVGLRLVLVERDSVGRLSELFTRLDGDGPRCLVLLDDVVFDEAGRGDRALRTALEGDVAARPANVAVWVTSNRMRLIHETRTGREDDVEEALGRGERAALATRFALRVHFPALDPDAYADIAEHLVRRAGGDTRDVRAPAIRYARDHGLTPRSAVHFAALVAAGVTPGAGAG